MFLSSLVPEKIRFDAFKINIFGTKKSLTTFKSGMFSRIHSINWVWGCIPLQFIFYPSNLNFLNSILYLVIPSPFHILYYIVPSTQCSYTLPRMKFPTVSLLFPDLMANIPYQFYMKLCEIFLLRQYFKILDTRGHGFL